MGIDELWRGPSRSAAQPKRGAAAPSSDSISAAERSGAGQLGGEKGRNDSDRPDAPSPAIARLRPSSPQCTSVWLQWGHLRRSWPHPLRV